MNEFNLKSCAFMDVENAGDEIDTSTTSISSQLNKVKTSFQ
jgi:hypothetical protein